MLDTIALSKTLSAASVKKFNNPFESFHWDHALDPKKLYFSPELISLYHTDTYAELTTEQIRTLSFWECINFFSINIHGERSLLQGVADRLYKQWPPEISEYLHHFLDEENKHMSVFGKFCTVYGNKIYPNKKISLPYEFVDGEKDFLFFAKIVIFEEFVDHFNKIMAKDERLDPLIRQINHYHHIDEARHLAFGRKIVQALFTTYAPTWSDVRRERISTYLVNYLQSTWKEYYNPSVYTDAKLDNGYALYQTAYKNSQATAFRLSASEKCLSFFKDNQIITTQITL